MDGELLSQQREFSHRYCSSLPVLKVAVKEKHVQKLRDKKEKAKGFNILTKEPYDYVPAKILYEGNKVKARVRLKGDWVDSHLNGDIWSLRVKVRGKKSVAGMQKFSIHEISTRGFTEGLLYQHVRSVGLLAPRYQHISYIFNNRKPKIVALEEHFAKELVEFMDRRESPVFAIDEDYLWRSTLLSYMTAPAANQPLFGRDWVEIKTPFRIFKPNRTSKSPVLRALHQEGLSLLRSYSSGGLENEQVFKMDEVGRWDALINIWGGTHGQVRHNLRLYFDPVAKKFEPIAFDNDNGEQIRKSECKFTWYFRGHTSETYQRAYLRQLAEIKQEIENGDFSQKLPRWERNLLSHDPDPKVIAGRIKRLEENIEQCSKKMVENRKFLVVSRRWDDVIFTSNKPQLSAAKPDLTRANFVNVYYIEENEKAFLEFESIYDYPVTIYEISLKSANKAKTVSRQTMVIPSRMHPNRLFKVEVQKLQDPGDSYWIRANMTKHEKPRLVKAIPYAASRFTPIYAEATREELEKLYPTFKVSKESVIIPEGVVSIKSDLVIPGNLSLEVRPGAKLSFSPKARLVVQNGLIMKGDQDRKIHLYPEDPESGWGGILVLRSEKRSVLQHVKIEGAKFDVTLEGRGITGAVTFYESDVDINDVIFEGHQTEDALNIMRSQFSLHNSLFEKGISDAVDIDFGKGTITDTKFMKFGGDAIDLSGSEVQVKNVSIENVADKGVSVGEKSVFRGVRISVSNAEIGVAVKDGSRAFLNESFMESIRGAVFASYNKKSSYGPSQFKIGHVKVDKLSELTKLTQYVAPNRIEFMYK